MSKLQPKVRRLQKGAKSERNKKKGGEKNGKSKKRK